MPETSGLAFYARAFDWGGHSGAAAVWNVANDRTPPTTGMTALAPTQAYSFFLVHWSGSDSFSGFDRFDVQVRRDGGAWQDWLLAQSATSTEAWYYGEPGHSYAFRVRGRDLAGNQEAYPASPDTSTAIAPCTTDSWEDDDTSVDATTLAPGATSGPHSFCGVQDADWFAFQAQAGEWYQIETTGLGTYTDTVLEVYDSLGVLLGQSDDRAPGISLGSFLPWRAPADGWYFVAVHGKDGRAAGDGLTYTFAISPTTVHVPADGLEVRRRDSGEGTARIADFARGGYGRAARVGSSRSLRPHAVRREVRMLKRTGLLIALGVMLGALAFAPAPRGSPREAGAPPSVELVGWLSIVHGDGEPGSGLAPRLEYRLIDELGGATSLAFAETIPEEQIAALRGQRVRVVGEWAAAAAAAGEGGARPLVAAEITAAEGAGPTGAGAAAPAEGAPEALTGSQPWVSVMCKFNDVATEPRGLSYFTNMYASTKPGLDHYWREVSYDNINVLGSTATGWYTLPHNRAYYLPGGHLDWSLAAEECTALADPVINFHSFVGINLMFNSDLDGYAWGGGDCLTLDGSFGCWNMTWEPPWGYAEHHGHVA